MTAEKTAEVASIGAFSVDTDLLSKAAARISGAELTQVNNGFKGSWDSDKAGTVCLSLPYDNGVTVKCDGEVIPIRHSLTAFTEFDLPAGKHDIEISFLPAGLVAGIIMSLLGAGVLVWVIVWQRIRKKRAAPAARPRTDTFCRILLISAGGVVILTVYILPVLLNTIFWIEP